nr:CBL-interacting serine/threonine-protein kinase 3-like [Physcomitrium patens]|eukprot:XP_024376647.1 CBL-interacting serine/threonine-protein kinase 3-like [Physcomitrella patens]
MNKKNQGMRVGKSELGRSLGAVTFAKIKFAKNLETSQSVAIKVLDKDKILKHKMVQQIKREISMMKLVKHPYIVQLLGVMASKSKIYIVLEYVTGGELFDKIVSTYVSQLKKFTKTFGLRTDILLLSLRGTWISTSTILMLYSPPAVNAFELISLSRGLNLSGLFETQSQPANEIISTIEKDAKHFAFNVQKRDYKMKLQADKYGRKGHLSVVT